MFLKEEGDFILKETMEKLKEFNRSYDEELVLSEKYKAFEDYLKQTVSGEGMVGYNNYLLLWKKDEIEELNDTYETEEFLCNVILIGSNGGDIAYGIDENGKYIEVPFIGMDEEEIIMIAENSDDFITYIWNRS